MRGESEREAGRKQRLKAWKKRKGKEKGEGKENRKNEEDRKEGEREEGKKGGR